MSADVDDTGKGCGVKLFDADDVCLKWLIVPLDSTWQGPTPCLVRDTPYSTSDTAAVLEVLQDNRLGDTIPERHRTFD